MIKDVLTLSLPLFKEYVMRYGLWETTFALTFFAVCMITVWRLPDLIEAIRKFKYKN